MTRILLILLLYILNVSSVKIVHDLPSYITPCKRDDPKIEECLFKNTESLRERIINGIPELGFPSVNPYLIPIARIEQGTRSVKFKATLRNIEFHGLQDYNPNNLTMYSEMIVPKFSMNGDYELEGQLMIAPIKGKGKISINSGQISLIVERKMKIIEKNGIDYLDVAVTESKIDISHPDLKLEGLFDGNENLNQMTNKIIKDNIDTLFEEFRPLIENLISTAFAKSFISTVLSNIPYDKLFPK